MKNEKHLSDNDIIQFNLSVLKSVVPEIIEYSNEAMDIITDEKGINPRAVIRVLKNFNFSADSMYSKFSRQGLIYADKYCLEWSIYYQNRIGEAIEDWDVLRQCKDLDPFIFIQIIRKLDKWEQGDPIPNSAIS